MIAHPDENSGLCMSNPVLYEIRGSTAWVTIDRPAFGNSLNAAVRSGLWSAALRFQEDTDAKVLVLTASGDRAFSAGGDLKEMAYLGLQEPPDDFLPHFGRNVHVAKPTIAAVNGVAYGGGFLLAQMCDLCIAAEHASFGISEVKVGRGSPWAALLPDLIGRRAALQLLLTGSPITAQRAYELGFVNDIVPQAELHSATQRLAETIAANAPLSVRAAVRMVDETVGLQPAQAYERADAVWRPVYRSRDAQEGPLSFLVGRPPVWSGS